MPREKYYCDYCNKQFPDTPSARKRHLQGVQHQRAKALWYDSLNASSHLSSTAGGGGPLPSGVCHRFIRTGSCQYGDGCRYLHPKQSNSNQTINLAGFVAKDHIGMSWGHIPPSLKPPPEGGYPALPFVDWG